MDKGEVFISYSRRNKDDAERLAKALEVVEFEPIWDVNLRGGDTFGQKLYNYICNARVVVVIWTEHSVESEWVLKEAGEALEQRKLLPIKLKSSVTPPPAFAAKHVEDLSDWDGDPDHPKFYKLQQAIAHIARRGKTDGFTLREPFENPTPKNILRYLRERADTDLGGLSYSRLCFGTLSMGLMYISVFGVALVLQRAHMDIWKYIWMIFPLIAILRLMHQFALVSQSRYSIRFYSGDFSFWFLMSLLCAVIIGGLITISVAAGTSFFVLLTTFVMLVSGLSFVLLFLFGLARFTISSSKLLFSRIR